MGVWKFAFYEHTREFSCTYLMDHILLYPDFMQLLTGIASSLATTQLVPDVFKVALRSPRYFISVVDTERWVSRKEL